MASRVRSNKRQVLKTDSCNGTIFNGRADYVLIGNIIIACQRSKNGTVSESRFNMADSTLRRLANDINSFLKEKHKAARKPYKKRLSFQERIEGYGW